MVKLLWKIIWQFLQKVKVEQLCDLVIPTPLLGLYPKRLKAGSQKDACTLMFRAAVFKVKT